MTAGVFPIYEACLMHMNVCSVVCVWEWRPSVCVIDCSSTLWWAYKTNNIHIVPSAYALYIGIEQRQAIQPQMYT